MPPGNRTPPTAEEIAVLEQWVQAKTPAYPEAFDERFTLDAIADDLDSQKAKPGNIGPHVRYASFAHLVRDGQPLPDLLEAERQLQNALFAATGAKITLQPVDRTATVFRFDLRDLGWSRTDLFEKMERLNPAGAIALRPFDLLLLEYPHATALPAADPRAGRLKPLVDPQSQVRPVPFVRGDWLASALSLPRQYRTPLALELGSLTSLEQAVAAGKEKPDGYSGPRPLGTAPALVVPKPADGRTPIAPLSGWYTGDVTPDPAPFTLTAELVSDSQVVKGVKVDQPFTLRVRSDRRVFVTLLVIQADSEVGIQEIGGGSVLQADTVRDLGPLSGRFSISGIVTGGTSATEYFVLFAAETELPLPTVVRSLHPERPVWRFLVPTSAPEPNRVVRKVIPIPVTKK
jgi:hypothetical protein